jgi:DNA topoisomerase VI subunit B
MEMEGAYQTGPHSVEAYLKQTAIANPHVLITFTVNRPGFAGGRFV